MVAEIKSSAEKRAGERKHICHAEVSSRGRRRRMVETKQLHRKRAYIRKENGRLKGFVAGGTGKFIGRRGDQNHEHAESS